ncbi:MAG: NUDIX hydrolase [Proteobacteria bacterium]|nr:NUDIX hydrolase [Pseudomonadota bacterium]MDA1022289.1 NUDIX hydrolase [Pseudomonadota bacterium]
MGNDQKTGPSIKQIPDGDDRERLVCADCGFIAYENPKVVVGAVCVWEDKFLICKRAIEPRKGFWTVPAGYLELNETTAEGARRETWEEARAEISIDGLIGVYEIPHISQIYVVHLGRMTSPTHAPGPESEDAQLLSWDALPWDDMAFPSLTWALQRYRDGGGPHFYTPPTEAP